MNAKVLVIMASGGWKFVEVEMKRGKVPLEFLQTAVGGWVECLGVPGRGLERADLYLNEEGKLKGMPLNIKATMLSGIHRHGDCIVRDAVVCSHNGNSDTVGLTQSQENALRAILAAIDANVPKSA